MDSQNSSSQELLNYLKFNGPTLSGELLTRFGISRPTLSRRVQELGDAVITIGKARATKIAARLQEYSEPTPLYRVLENGQAEPIGELTPIRDGERTQWLLESENAPAALFEGEFKEGLYPGWPWFLEDMRPSGFLGRAFGKWMAKLHSYDTNPEKWNDSELLRTLSIYGSNLQGNLILGDASLEEFQSSKVSLANERFGSASPDDYPRLAQYTLTGGEELGSSAGGEQPKFTILVQDSKVDTRRAVIVKFSPKLDSASGQRWADLLYAEHLANAVLREAGFATAQTRTFHFENRVFLESERFDRIGATGRRGLVSLRALDTAHLGMGQGSWAKAARKLHAGKWITAEDCERMTRLHCFGELIANSDMHWGNLSFFLSDHSPLPLAPVYDMLPMRFRPSSTGEVLEREFKPTLPKPEDQAAWLEMHPHALTYWQRIAQHPEITPSFKQIAEQATQALERIHKIATT